MLSKYRVLEEISKKDGAAVYLAEHRALGVKRIIKFIKKAIPYSEQLMGEAHLMKYLEHPCIPTIYDIDEDDVNYYIVEQFIEGESLKEILEKKTISEHQAVNYLEQLCGLIKFLHFRDKPILHLDLKPSNIMVSSGKVMVIDFGSAMYKGSGRNRFCFGTPGYCSPEQLSGAELDESSDIYSLGCIIRKMLERLCGGSEGSSKAMELLEIIAGRCTMENSNDRYTDIAQIMEVLHRNCADKINTDKSMPMTISVAGAAANIGATHLCFLLCSYLRQKSGSIYFERNSSGTVRKVLSEKGVLLPRNGIYMANGTEMVPEGKQIEKEAAEGKFCIQDYGAWKEDMFSDFVKSGYAILISGTKEWELEEAENAILTFNKLNNVIWFMNFTEPGRFSRLSKSHKGLKCCRLPYIADPFTQDKKLLREVFGKCIPWGNA